MRATWKSQLGFIWAAAGAAVGLGNIWRFPTVAALGGGGAFLVGFIVLVLIVGLPTMMGEMAVGRHTARGPIGAYRFLAPSTRWTWLGYLGAFINVAILSYYSALAGACLAYTVRYLAATLHLQPPLAGLGSGGVATPILTAGQATIWFLVFLVINALVTGLGIQKGVERASSFLMPMLILLLLAIAARVAFLDGAMEGIVWFLTPRLNDLGIETFFHALGQLFFSLSLGSGIMITYASYLERTKSDIPNASLWIVLNVTGVSLLAGLVMIPALFAFDLPVVSGPELVFYSLTGIFAEIPLGQLFGAIFFAALAVAALTSTFSILEVPVTALLDEWGWSRSRAVVVTTGVTFILGIPSALSIGGVSTASVAGLPFFAAVDRFASDMLLPVSGILSVIFIGWVWGAENARAELARGARHFHSERFWTFAIRYIVPASIAAILVARFIT